MLATALRELGVLKFIFLDRDGVINRRIIDGYVTAWEQFEFLPDVLDALRLLRENSYEVIVVSNQAGVGKGLIDPDVLEDITRRFTALVEAHGGQIRDVYYCPHREEDGCGCRKPEIGLLVKAQAKHGFNFAHTFLIGDAESDLIAAARVGCPAILVKSDAAASISAEQPFAAATVRNLYEAVRLVIFEQHRDQFATGRANPLQAG